MKKSWLYLFKNAPNTMDAYDFFKISKIQSKITYKAKNPTAEHLSQHSQAAK